MAQSQNMKDLAFARTKTSFNVTDMTNYLYGGAANVEQRRYVIDLIAREPIFNKSDWYRTCFSDVELPSSRIYLPVLTFMDFMVLGPG